MSTRIPTAAELEAHAEAKFRNEVRLIGGRVSKLAPVDKGMPDRLVLLPGGRIFLVELKRAKGGRLSAAQQLWHQRAREVGTNVVVLAGVDEATAWVRQQAQAYDPKPRRSGPKRTRTVRQGFDHLNERVPAKA